jgi:hypothetical protein
MGENRLQASAPAFLPPCLGERDIQMALGGSAQHDLHASTVAATKPQFNNF